MKLKIKVVTDGEYSARVDAEGPRAVFAYLNAGVRGRGVDLIKTLKWSPDNIDDVYITPVSAIETYLNNKEQE